MGCFFWLYCYIATTRKPMAFISLSDFEELSCWIGCQNLQHCPEKSYWLSEFTTLTREKLKQPLFGLTIHWRLSTILKRSNKSISSNIFWYVKVYIFCIIHYATHWDKTQMLKKYPWDKINVSNVLFFLLKVPAHLSFTFN